MKRSPSDQKRSAGANGTTTPPGSKGKSKAEPEDGFLGRWSQRKQSAPNQSQPTAEEAQSQLLDEELPTDLPTDDLPAEVTDTAVNAVTAEDTDTPVLTDVDMPDVDTLNADSDYSPFLSEGVSKELRNLALKKLFFSGKFALRDGLDDYDDDFTYFEPLGDTVTSDMKFHARRKERAREEELAREEMALREEDAEELEEESQEEVSEELTSEEARQLQSEENGVLESDPTETDDSPDDQPDNDITLAEQEETQNPSA